ncbi:MAG: CocE/NonD family hydrolase [Phycisphaeraceae bacterium]|nr:CocE/NonD family hydrolase [Phycisphaeraceae bacterium]
MQENLSALNIITDQDVAVPMRDGVLLRANIFRPNTSTPLPVLLQRTPYKKASAGYEPFVRAGYVVISQDTRGRYASDGEFKVFSEEDTGDPEDGYDTVEWAASQPWCDGNVGTFGKSYDGWMQYQLAKLQPPHLKAMSAVAIPTELTDLDWPGAFKPARRIHWWLNDMAPDLRRRAGMLPPHTPSEAQTIWDELENGRMLALLPWSRVVEYLPEPLASQAASWLREPARCPWKFREAHKRITVPNLDFPGWYDHCSGIDHLGSMQEHATTQEARKQTRAIIGPWNHLYQGRRKQGIFDFGINAEMDLIQIQIRWFDYWLKDIRNGIDQEPVVQYFVMGSEQWKFADTWPPKNLDQVAFHLASKGDAHVLDGSGTLQSEPLKNGATDTYAYDPYDPTPTLWDRTCVYNVSDRRHANHRPDILRYDTKPLQEDLEVVGNPEVILYAASSAPDTDFFDRLVDDNPDGPAMEVCYGLVRARHRNGFDTDELLTPGHITQFRIRLGATACCFRKGHRIRLEIYSSDFPNHDRNHNTGKNDLFDAEMVIAQQTIHHSPKHPSSLILPTCAAS